MREIGEVDIGLVMLVSVKVITLLLAIVAGLSGKLLRVKIFRLGVRVIVAKLILLIDTD